MISQVDNIIKNLEKKEKIINYLKNIYKVEVGEEPTIPEAYIDQNIIDEKNIESNFLKFHNLEPHHEDEANEIYSTFHEKFISLRLPSMEDKKIKEKIAKIKKEKEKSSKPIYNHLTDMDLSGYGEKGFNLELLRMICETMKLFKTLTSINLSHNSIDDSFVEVIIDFLSMNSLKSINLSFNQLSKNAMKKITPIIRTNITLEYIDLRGNPFCMDESCCFNICNSLRMNSHLSYFGLSDCSTDSSGIKLLTHKNKTIKTLLLEDSRYNSKSFEILRKCLMDKHATIENLSLEFNTIDFTSLNSIEKGLRLNKSLSYLNLKSCGISDLSSANLISVFEYNKTLKEINLSSNKLASQFCKGFSKILKLNKALSNVNISKNYDIKDIDFELIVESLVDNQSIISLGDLEETKIGVKLRESVDVILHLNKQFFSNEMSLENTQAKKFNFLKASLDMEQYKSEINSINKMNNNISNRENEFSNFEDLINKYSIEFGIHDYQNFHYEQQ